MYSQNEETSLKANIEEHKESQMNTINVDKKGKHLPTNLACPSGSHPEPHRVPLWGEARFLLKHQPHPSIHTTPQFNWAKIWKGSICGVLRQVHKKKTSHLHELTHVIFRCNPQLRSFLNVPNPIGNEFTPLRSLYWKWTHCPEQTAYTQTPFAFVVWNIIPK